jgi:DNA polymerase-3 subunit epsilon
MFKIFKKKKKFYEYKGASIGETDFAVVDTELTGLSELKDTIISIGSLKMKGKSIKMGEVFYRTVKPESFIKKDSIMVHEITPAELESCPDIVPILREYLAFVKDLIIVGHCISIDITFLKKAIHKHLNQIYDPIAIDVFAVYNWLIQKDLLPEEFIYNKSLRDIAYSLDIEAKQLHDSLSDAFVTAQVFQRLITLLGEIKIYTVDDLLNIGNPNIKLDLNLAKKQTFQF